MSFKQVKSVLGTKVWGERSLTIGNLAALIIGAVLVFLKPLGTWSLWIGFAVIALGIALF